MKLSTGPSRATSDCVIVPLQELPEDMHGVAKQRLQKSGIGAAVVPTASVLVLVYEFSDT